MEFLELVSKRYSERYFSEKPIEQDKINKILESGRLVPTACNYQPQKFYILKSKKSLELASKVTPLHASTGFSLIKTNNNSSS